MIFDNLKISRNQQKEDTVIEIKGIKIGGGNCTIIGGPCSVESREMIMSIGEAVKAGGGTILRGGAFKPRTSPYDFQGLGEDALIYLKEAGDAHGLLTVTEVMDTRDIEVVAKYSDILQVGARNMQNFSLLKALGSCGKPVLLKRGMCATLKEFLMAAEYLMAHGNSEIILCERGIRTFENYTRNTVDINIIPAVKQESHLPIIIDASHGTGVRSLVEPVTLAGISAGADGAMIEVHQDPDNAISDGEQSLNFPEYIESCKKIFKLHSFMKEL